MKCRLTFISDQIQLTVSEDGIVTVVEPGGGKLVDKEELHEAIKMPGTDHTLTVHQLQQIVGQQVSTWYTEYYSFPIDSTNHSQIFQVSRLIAACLFPIYISFLTDAVTLK